MVRAGRPQLLQVLAGHEGELFGDTLGVVLDHILGICLLHNIFVLIPSISPLRLHVEVHTVVSLSRHVEERHV